MASAPGPLSVALPKRLRDRLAVEARKRGLPLSTAVRVLVAERVRDLDEAAELSAVDQWQRAQAWRTWEDVQSGGAAEATSAEIDKDFEAAIARVRRRPRT